MESGGLRCKVNIELVQALAFASSRLPCLQGQCKLGGVNAGSKKYSSSRRFNAFMKTVQDAVDSMVFQPLPYEVAHAVVRTLCMHSNCFLKAKEDYKKLQEGDPNIEKPKTVKAKEEYTKLCKVDRWIVMNRRTGWVATHDWLTKHMVLSADGRPSVRKKDSRCNPWLLTLRIVITGSQVDLMLRPDDSKPFRAVRCFDLENGRYKTHLGSITTGYEHLFKPNGEDSKLLMAFNLP